MHTLVLDVIASETARMPIEKCQRALTQKQTFVSWFERRAGLLERLQRRVALEALCNRGSSFVTEPVALETVQEWGSEVGG